MILPKAVRKRNSSPSRQKRSHTRQAVSSGNDLLNNVNILTNKIKENIIILWNLIRSITIANKNSVRTLPIEELIFAKSIKLCIIIFTSVV